MRLAVHDLAVQGRATLPAGVHALYLQRGSLRVNGAALAEDNAILAPAGASLEGDAQLWRFTVATAAEDLATLILSHALPRDPAQPFVLRLDRVDFAKNGVTPKHGHAGPGIRRLLSGLLLAEVGEQTRRIAPGEAWHETGAEPVVGRVLAPGTAFIRAMMLDPALLGQPTFRPWTADDATKARGVSYRLFLDRLCQLEAA